MRAVFLQCVLSFCAERRKTERARARESAREREREEGGGERKRKFYLERYSMTQRTKRAEAGTHNNNHKRSKRACNKETGPRVHATKRQAPVCMQQRDRPPCACNKETGARVHATKRQAPVCMHVHKCPVRTQK
jgi:hypothetical protein